MSYKHLIEVGPGFYNLRSHFRILGGILDVGTQMSFVRLESGRFLLIDTCPVPPAVKTEVDQLTQNGSLIDAVIGVHPFHTMYFASFHKLYPEAPLYGTSRHLKNLSDLPWKGDIATAEVQGKWSPEILFSIPEGADLVNANENIHFSSILVFHPASKTVHVDDTLFYVEKSGLLLRFIGIKQGEVNFHPSTFKGALYPTAEAPEQFRSWVKRILSEWDFDNLACAHNGNLIGGAKVKVQKCLDDAGPAFAKLIAAAKK